MKKLFVIIFAVAMGTTAFAELLSFKEAAELAQKAQAGAVIDMELDRAYELSIFAADGNVYKLELDVISGKLLNHYTDSIREELQRAFRNIKINHLQALAIAEAELPDSTVISFDTNLHSGKAEYELELVDGKGIAYKILIDATDGKLISVKQDEKIYKMPAISKADAEKAALSARAGTAIYTTIDEDHGRANYEVKIYAEGRLYEVRIDGASGKVLKIEID